MQITEDLKKFLSSEWGQKMVMTAYLMGSEFFKFGKKKWLTRDLRGYVTGLNMKDSSSRSSITS